MAANLIRSASGNVFLLGKGQDAAVKIQPAQFPVDKNGSSLMLIPLFSSSGGCRYQITYARFCQDSTIGR